MIYQSTIFDIIEGKKLADAGLSLAIETANSEHEGWQERCWNLFLIWLGSKPKYFKFMIEDFRKYVEDYDLLGIPKSNRAFGFISIKAQKSGLIYFLGHGKVKNKKAHAANASIWYKK